MDAGRGACFGAIVLQVANCRRLANSMAPGPGTLGTTEHLAVAGQGVEGQKAARRGNWRRGSFSWWSGPDGKEAAVLPPLTFPVSPVTLTLTRSRAECSSSTQMKRANHTYHAYILPMLLARAITTNINHILQVLAPRGPAIPPMREAGKQLSLPVHLHNRANEGLVQLPIHPIPLLDSLPPPSFHHVD